jgi:hypothetical protein
VNENDFELVVKIPKGTIMTEVSFDASFIVAPPVTPPPNPLTLTPSSAEFDLQEGVAADGTAVTTVSDGTAPYTFAMDPASGPLPAGITFVEDPTGTIVTLAGTPAPGSSANSPYDGVILDVTDSAGNVAQLKAKVIGKKK